MANRSSPWNEPYVPVHTLFVTAVQIFLYYVGDVGLRFSLPIPVRPGTEWRLLTLVLVHADATHLWGNLLVTLTVGLLFEAIHGPVRTALVYWTAGLAASICEVLTWTPPAVALLGSSGAVFGLVGAATAHVLLNREPMAPHWRLWALLVVLVVGEEAYRQTFAPSSNVAYAAHAAGAIYGAVLGACVVRNVEFGPVERWVGRLGAFAAVAGMATLLILLCARVAVWSV